MNSYLHQQTVYLMKPVLLHTCTKTCYQYDCTCTCKSNGKLRATNLHPVFLLICLLDNMIFYMNKRAFLLNQGRKLCFTNHHQSIVTLILCTVLFLIRNYIQVAHVCLF